MPRLNAALENAQRTWATLLSRPEHGIGTPFPGETINFPGILCMMEAGTENLCAGCLILKAHTEGKPLRCYAVRCFAFERQDKIACRVAEYKPKKLDLSAELCNFDL